MYIDQFCLLSLLLICFHLKKKKKCHHGDANLIQLQELFDRKFREGF